MRRASHTIASRPGKASTTASNMSASWNSISAGDATLACMFVRDDGFVPKERYTSREFVELEMDRLWPRVWQVACREEQIPEVGDYLEYTIGDQSILVVRSAPDTITASYNACLHRGTRLGEGTGHFDDGTIRCRFHAWCYALAGPLTHLV